MKNTRDVSKPMNPTLFHFENAEFLRIGKLLADRDAFIVFYNLAHAGPVNIGYLCSIFRREPSTLSEILKALIAAGLARRRGGLYCTTAFGAKALRFLKDTTERIELAPADSTAASLTQFSTTETLQSQPPATNNTVMSNFRVTSAVRLVGEDVGPLKLNQVSNEPEGERFAQAEPPDPPPENAARSHNYL